MGTTALKKVKEESIFIKYNRTFFLRYGVNSWAGRDFRFGPALENSMKHDDNVVVTL